MTHIVAALMFVSVGALLVLPMVVILTSALMQSITFP